MSNDYNKAIREAKKAKNLANAVGAQLAEKANITDVRLKSVKLEQTDCSDTLKEQIAGTAGLLSIPEDKSVTLPKLNIPFASIVSNLAYGHASNIGSTITFSDFNDVELAFITRNLSNYYILINITPIALIDSKLQLNVKAIDANSGGGYVATTILETLTKTSLENFTLVYELDATGFTSTNLLLKLAARSATGYQIKVNSVMIIDKNTTITTTSELTRAIEYYGLIENYPVMQTPVTAKTIDYIDDFYKNVDHINITAISIFGDSMTGGLAIPMATETGMTCNNLGVGGENVLTTMGRIGCMPWHVEPFTIPADTTPVTITIKSKWNTNALNPYLSFDSGKTPVKIGGVEGYMVGVNDSTTRDVFTFQRKEAGATVTFNKPVPVYILHDINFQNTFHFVWFGTNGSWSDIDDLVAMYECVADYCNGYGQNYLFMGFYIRANVYKADFEAYEAKMLKRFGRHFINTREYLINYGLEDCGLTATQADLDAIANGQVPPQLLSDGTHMTATTNTAVLENLIYPRLKELHVYSSI